MARNLAKAFWVVVLPLGDTSSAGVPGFTATRLSALCAAAFSPEGPGVEMESFAKGFAFRGVAYRSREVRGGGGGGNGGGNGGGGGVSDRAKMLSKRKALLFL